MNSWIGNYTAVFTTLVSIYSAVSMTLMMMDLADVSDLQLMYKRLGETRHTFTTVSKTCQHSKQNIYTSI
jgi:hypothetical protein